jgi:hypothetical protein
LRIDLFEELHMFGRNVRKRDTEARNVRTRAAEAGYKAFVGSIRDAQHNDRRAVRRASSSVSGIIADRNDDIHSVLNQLLRPSQKASVPDADA